MKIILTHIGRNLPEYLKYTFFQIRKFNPDIDIIFITNKYNIDLMNKYSEFNIKLFFAEDLYNEKIRDFVKLLGRNEDDFWCATATRIFYIEELMKKENLTNIIHFENDVLLYNNIFDFSDKIINLYENLAITPGGFDRVMTGFFYIKNFNSLKYMTDFWIELLKTKSMYEIIKMYKVDMINEMSLMFIYTLNYDKSFIDYFPILPNGKYSEYLPLFNSVFDPASYGQYVGGLPAQAGGTPPGFLDDNHHIGHEFLINRNDYDVEWKLENYNKIPYLRYKEKYYKINNLHIHCKKLENFI